MIQPKIDKHSLIRSICRESYYDHCQTFWHTVVAEEPVWNWHVKVFCDRFQEVMERLLKNEPRRGDEVVNVPPGTTKSLVHSVFPMSWLWTRSLTFKGIFGSFSKELAFDLSMKSRDVIQSELYQACFPEVQLRDDQNAKGLYWTTKGGFRLSTAMRSKQVTGRHAHLIVVDDPVDPQQAISEADLKRTNSWLSQTLSTRKVNKATTVTYLVMQRLSELDPTSLFLKRPGCRKLVLPAELSEDVYPVKYRENYVDGLLDAVRMPKKVLEEAEEDLGQYGYQGQFMQRPTPPEGGMFKVNRLKFTAAVPRDLKRIIRFWDKAATHEGGTYTAGVKMAVRYDASNRPEYFVLDVIRGQWDSGARENRIKDTADAEGVEVGVEQEGAGGGKESMENTVKNLSGHRVRVLKVGRSEGDKVQRADPFSVQVNHGNVTLIYGDWNDKYVDELKHFPEGKYKDQVDASSGAFSFLRKKRRRLGGVDALLMADQTAGGY